MTWTYDPTQLATSSLFRVRFLCGDTDSSDEQVQDEEISYILTQTTNEKLAAAIVCEHLSRKFSRLCSKSIGSLSVSAGERASAYAKRALELRSEAGLDALPFVGGLSKSEKETLASDSDRIQPQFEVGMDDNPNSPDSISSIWQDERY